MAENRGHRLLSAGLRAAGVGRTGGPSTGLRDMLACLSSNTLPDLGNGPTLSFGNCSSHGGHLGGMWGVCEPQLGHCTSSPGTARSVFLLGGPGGVDTPTPSNVFLQTLAGCPGVL
jgi:hypothetical protein